MDISVFAARCSNSQVTVYPKSRSDEGLVESQQGEDERDKEPKEIL
jgi:hypothetical protein